MQQQTLLQFPCEFDVKAMGLTADNIDIIVVAIIRGYVVTDINQNDIKIKYSSKGKFMSVSVTINATSQTQLDTIYQALKDHQAIKYVL